MFACIVCLVVVIVILLLLKRVLRVKVVTYRYGLEINKT